MEEYFTYLDPEASFWPGSRGTHDKRLIDTTDKAILGAESWELGMRAYGELEALAGRLSADDLRQLADQVSKQIPNYLDLIEENVAKGRLSFDDGKTPDRQQIDQESLAWRIAVVLKIFEGTPAGEDLASDFAEWLAIGCLAALDEAVFAATFSMRSLLSSVLADAAWLVGQFDSAARANLTVARRLRGAAKTRAAAGARKRHAVDPKQKAKKLVKQRYLAWKADVERYASAAAFARDMLDTFHDLESHAVICGWVRQWDKESE